jgi:peptidyl-prolyl cis-trans isomerase C
MSNSDNKIKVALWSLLLLFTVCAVFVCVKYNGATMDNNKQQNNSSAAQCKEVSAKHILVSTESEANDILKKINSNSISFEEAAKKWSSCPSKNNSGDLGYFGRGMMVKEFEDAAFSTEKGAISAPVKTQFGWHLIKVTDKR